MEENLHEDKLDDYVRKSFEEYEETPSSDMWDRVAADLEETPERVPLWLVFRRLGWQLLAAGVILVLTSTLVCEHLYYKAQIQELTQQSQKSVDSRSSSNANVPSYYPVQQNSEITQKPGFSNRNSPQTASKIKSTFPEPTSAVERLGQQQFSNTPLVPSTQTSLADALVQDVQQESILEHPAMVSCQNIPVLLTPLTHVDPILPVLEQYPFVPNSIISPAKDQTGWYAGVASSILYRMEKNRIIPSRPGRPAFSSEATGSQMTSIHWVKVGKQWANHWSLESGLGYQESNRSAVHRPTFRFGDGTHSGMGPRRNFNYDLNTSNGTAEVSLRMEQTQPGNPSDDEPVSLRIETTESTQWVRIPLLLGYQWGERRLKGFVQTGLLANVVVRNQFIIAARVSENARFKPVDGQDGYTINLSQKRFVPGYWLGAGIGYQLGQHFQIQAEACISGDFPRNDLYRRRLPERYLAGVNLGLSYYF